MWSPPIDVGAADAVRLPSDEPTVSAASAAALTSQRQRPTAIRSTSRRGLAAAQPGAAYQKRWQRVFRLAAIASANRERVTSVKARTDVNLQVAVGDGHGIHRRRIPVAIHEQETRVRGVGHVEEIAVDLGAIPVA